MFEVKIYKNGIHTNGAIFESYQAALDWIAYGNDQGWWQTEERQEIIPAVKEWKEVEVQPEIKDEDGNVIQERVVEMQEIVITPEQVVIYPPTHTFEIIDITEEISKQKALESQKQLRLKGEFIIDILNIKIKELALDSNQIMQLFTDKNAIFIRELIWSGNLELAKNILLEKRSDFENIMGQELTDWLINTLEQELNKFAEEFNKSETFIADVIKRS